MMKRKIINVAEEGKTKGHVMMYKGTKIKMTADFSLGAMQVRRCWSNIFKVLMGKNCQTIL